MTPVGGQGQSPGAPRAVDVARLAGVSQKTVSRVFNGERYVSADVRGRVLQAAEELGYRLNSAARALASGRTRSIGVVALGTALYGPASLLIGIERAARDAGYALRVVNTQEGDPAGVAGAVESLLEQGVDGIVVSEPIDEGSVPLSAGVPVLVLGAPATFGGPRAVAAGVGAESLARAATEHLLDLGHVTVHHLAGPQGGSPPGTVSRAGGRRSRNATGHSRPSSRATGRPRPATRPAANSPPPTTSPRCSPPTTTWPSA